MRFPLWQRIFVYTIALVIVSQVLAFVLHNALNRDDMRRRFADGVRVTAEELNGQPLEMALVLARMHTRGPFGILLIRVDGSPIPDMAQRQALFSQSKIEGEWNFDDVVILEVDKDPKVWGKALISLRDGQYWLYMSFGPPPRSVKSVFLFQLFTPVLLASFLLALWMAWSVSRPLRRLRNEVREMSQTGPGCKVTVTGKDEISDVAGAVNGMSETLAKHVQGMYSLVVNVSHELRSPLTRANLALGIIEDSLPPEYGGGLGGSGEANGCAEANRDMAAKYLAVLQEEMNHMDALIGTTLLTQKLDLQIESTPMEHLDFSVVCADSWKRYEPTLRRNGFVLNAEIAEGVTIKGNRILLAQMLTNLLDNCLKYTTENGEIHFTLTVRKGNCSLCIENSHKKITEAQVDHIFDPFYRIDQGTGTGIGLGLALVQKTAALHKGDIMAVTTEIGLCICLQLPLVSAGEASRPLAPA